MFTVHASRHYMEAVHMFTDGNVPVFQLRAGTTLVAAAPSSVVAASSAG